MRQRQTDKAESKQEWRERAQQTHHDAEKRQHRRDAALRLARLKCGGGGPCSSFRIARGDELGARHGTWRRLLWNWLRENRAGNFGGLRLRWRRQTLDGGHVRGDHGRVLDGAWS